MRKSFVLENLDCAACAAKMEAAVRRLDGVTDASVDFLRGRLMLEAPDERFDEVFQAVEKACRRVERDLRIVR